MKVQGIREAMFQVDPRFWYSIFHDDRYVPWVYAYDKLTNETFVGGVATNWEDWSDEVDEIQFDGGQVDRRVRNWIENCERTVARIRKAQAEEKTGRTTN